MLHTAQTVAQSPSASAVIFGLAAVGLIVFGLYTAVQASLDPTYLRVLRAVLAVLSLAFATALVYETVSLTTRRVPSISRLADAAFQTSPIQWVAIFAVLMAVVGALALHFTRVAHVSTRLVAAERSLAAGALPPLWAVLFALAIVVASFLVHRFTNVVAPPAPNDPGFSWWVLFLGGGAYGVGALLAWALNWRPY